MNTTERNTKILAVLVAALSLAVVLSLPSLASAEFTRPYITQITQAPTGLFGEEVPFPSLGGLASENKSDGNLFVGSAGNALSLWVDEFNSSNAFVEPQITGLQTGSLAFDDKSGGLVDAGEEEYVAADNTTTRTGGDVYVGSSSEIAGVGDGGATYRGSVRRLNANGEPEPFSCVAEHHEEYVNGNELTGKPGEKWGREPNGEESTHLAVNGVAVDSGSGASAGDIYVINNEEQYSEIDQFTPDGCFVRAITKAAVPETVTFIDLLHGVAVDPTDGDVLVERKDSSYNEVIDEFTESGEYLGQITGRSKTDQFGRVGLGAGIAVSSAGNLYVSVCEEYGGGSDNCVKSVVDEFGPGAYFPGAVTGEVSGAEPKAVTLNGVVRGVEDSEKQDLAIGRCEVEYVLEEDFLKQGGEGGFHSAVAVPCVLESGLSPVGQMLEEKNYPVHGDAKNLEAGKVYEYRLVVASGGAHGGTQVGEVASFAAPAAPQIEAVSVGDVSSSFADFSAKIDPRGSDTTYQFQYVDTVAYEAAVAAGAPDPYAGGGSVPVPAGEIGAGDRYVSVGVQASGLSPGSAYDYRVLASNGAGEASVKGTFATVPEGLRGLPDGRAYELVTPVNKGDAEDLFGSPGLVGEQNLDRGFAAEDGEHFLLSSRADFGPFPASGEGAYVFSRGADGWTFKSVVSPSLGVQGLGNLVFDPADLSTVGAEDLVGSAEYSGFDLDGPPGGPYATLALGFPAGESERVNEVGASTDLSTVVLESEDHKLPVCEGAQQAFAETLDVGVNGVYQWSTKRQCLSLVDVESQSEGGGLLSKCGAVLGRGESKASSGDMRGAVSADGSKVFFTAPDPGYEDSRSLFGGPGCWNGGTRNPPELYMREDGNTTVEVSAPENGEEPEYPAIYVGASENGAKVFFLTRGELTEEAEKLKTHDPELYEYDSEAPEGKRLIRISRGDLESGPVEGRVLSVPAVSADGSTVYFNAEGDLAPGGEHGGLYRYDTDTGQTAYVAPGQGYPGIFVQETITGGERSRYAWFESEVIDRTMPSLDLEASYYTTRDGQFLLFGPYRYDAADGSVVCVMCNPDGSGPIAGAYFTRSAFEGDDPAGGPPRGMSENGEYVFFDTTESLVPQDTNGTLDVYEWHEEKGSASHEGTISLISSGTDPKPSYFLGSSSCTGAHGETVEGCNVFFGTHAKLVPEDTDNSGDLYDARIGGGFQTSAGAGPCEGDACDNPPPPPLAPSPSTFTSTSSGNVAGGTSSPMETVTKKTVKCKQGLVKKKVKTKTECVRAKGKSKAKKSAKPKRGGKS